MSSLEYRITKKSEKLVCRTCKKKLSLYSGSYVVHTYEEYLTDYQCLSCYEDENF